MAASQRLLHDDDLADDADSDCDEEHALLQPAGTGRARGGGPGLVPGTGPPPSTWANLGEIIEIAVPSALGNLSEFLPITFAMGMVGQLNG